MELPDGGRIAEGLRADLVVVDGRERARCAARATAKVRPGGLLLVDDIDRERAIDETLTSIRRAGADAVLTYWATEVAERWARA